MNAYGLRQTTGLTPIVIKHETQRHALAVLPFAPIINRCEGLWMLDLRRKAQPVPMQQKKREDST